MRDEYILQLVNAVLEGRKIVYRPCMYGDENSDGKSYNAHGIGVGPSPTGNRFQKQSRSHLICYWYRGDEPWNYREIELEEAIKLVEKHFP